MDSQTTQNPAGQNAAKFAFFYLLSLVALIFMALSTGMIIFQIINKTIADIATTFPGSYNSSALKFAISAVIIATPIYYSMMTLINKSLKSGALDKEAGVRRWLTYFILLIAAVVVIGWLIAVINSFLEGELTTKFILKALTAIVISGAIFSYYFYDIRRDKVVGEKDKAVSVFFYASLAVVLATLISSFFIVESPRETRARKQDSAVLNRFNQIDNSVNSYYFDNGALPAGLSDLISDKGNYFISENDLKDPATGAPFDYKTTGRDSYELCATFKTSNKATTKDTAFYDYGDRWPHDSGYQCIGQKVRSEVKGGLPLEAPLLRQ